MKALFEVWHEKKSDLDDIPECPFFREREVWFCYLGKNVGSEQDGTGNDFLRPVVIVRKFNNEIFWAVPLTKRKANRKRSLPAQDFYFAFSFLPDIESEAILSQIRLVDGRRLARRIGEMGKSDFTQMRKRLTALLP